MTDAAFSYLADVDWVGIHMDCANTAGARVRRNSATESRAAEASVSRSNQYVAWTCRRK